MSFFFLSIFGLSIFADSKQYTVTTKLRFSQKHYKLDWSSKVVAPEARRRDSLHNQDINPQGRFKLLSTLLDEALPAVFGSASVLEKFVGGFIDHHEWVNVVLQYSESFSRSYRALLMASKVNLVIFAAYFVIRLTFSDSYDDCKPLVTQGSCVQAATIYDPYSAKCYWDPYSSTCLVNIPTKSSVSILVICLLAVIGSLLPSLLLGAMFKRMFSKYTPAPGKSSAKVSDSSTAVAEQSDRPSSALSRFLDSCGALIGAMSEEDFSAFCEERVFSLRRLQGAVAQPGSESDSGSDDREQKPSRVPTDSKVAAQEVRQAASTAADTARNIVSTEVMTEIRGVLGNSRRKVLEAAARSNFNAIRAMFAAEMGRMRYMNSEQKCRFVIHSFVGDLLPDRSTDILRSTHKRDNEAPLQLSPAQRWALVAAVALANAAALSYVLVDASAQRPQRQTLLMQVLAVWLVLDILCLAPLKVLLLHLYVPATITDDVKAAQREFERAIGEKLAVEKRQLVGRWAPVDLAPRTDAIAPPLFDVSQYFFFSHHVAEQHSELSASRIVLSYKTPVSKFFSLPATGGFDAFYRGYKNGGHRHFRFFSLPVEVQDLIVQASAQLAVFALLLACLQLYLYSPALAVIPVLLLAAALTALVWRIRRLLVGAAAARVAVDPCAGVADLAMPLDALVIASGGASSGGQRLREDAPLHPLHADPVIPAHHARLRGLVKKQQSLARDNARQRKVQKGSDLHDLAMAAGLKSQKGMRLMYQSMMIAAEGGDEANSQLRFKLLREAGHGFGDSRHLKSLVKERFHRFDNGASPRIVNLAHRAAGTHANSPRMDSPRSAGSDGSSSGRALVFTQPYTPPLLSARGLRAGSPTVPGQRQGSGSGSSGSELSESSELSDSSELSPSSGEELDSSGDEGRSCAVPAAPADQHVIDVYSPAPAHVRPVRPAAANRPADAAQQRPPGAVDRARDNMFQINLSAELAEQRQAEYHLRMERAMLKKL